MQKFITILGPTAIGKSSLAIALAQDYNGAIISADSRQIYKDFDIGSGKVTKPEMQGVPHYMLDILDLWLDYNLSEFQREVNKILDDLIYQNTLPFLVGGTGLYIESIVYNYQIPSIAPKPQLREHLSKLNKIQLQEKLVKLKPNHNLNYSDWNNPVRLIRAIEMAGTKQDPTKNRGLNPYQPLLIGLKSSLEDIRNRITKRVDERLNQGAVEEIIKIKNILNKHLAPDLVRDKIQQLGLGTIAINEYLENQIDYETMRDKYIQSEYQYARRQLTWFRRMPEISWFDVNDTNLYGQVKQTISDFLE